MSELPPIPDHLRHRTVTLPNGYEVVYQSRAEARYFYHDVFEKRVYLKNGLTLADGDCVFDVGGNIGMTTMFMHSLGHRITSFTFEPAPRLFEILRANASRYAPRAQLFNFGISDQPGEAEFTFYPNSPGMSTFHPALHEERETLLAIMENQLRQGMDGMPDVMKHADDLLEERFRAETFRCRLRPLSEVIYEHQVARIDLLKVDVQKSELQVLRGIDDADWPRIRQVVLEVHDVDGGLARVTSLLERHGFQVTPEQDDMYAGSTLYNLYAVRARETVPAPAGSAVLERARALASRQRHAGGASRNRVP
ncbi:FkbM family methyltransferase [Longimicrobium sp.]|uniref:FkbM family methyltransferase n=1 Tax=Longimicrobium sp. TaxID=2029185 RepID=UPI002E31FD12|nr:FkbM family methyltransferase [Longimicrobium sp.]HEX6036830.1 FkbM family methyltransferase [Longimicrobium sp.]